jgi:ferredoxin
MSTRLSKPGRWRILSLLLVHVLIAVHIVHWKLAGTSLSSIELSGAGRLAVEGVATAALFLFVFLVLVTAIFGRIFCGWGCHMLAIQEACRLALERMGIPRPRPIASRVLWLVPFALAFYVFFAPAVEHLWLGVSFPAPRLELTSANLWGNLPRLGETIASILICGFAMVYFLGGLSFCKFVCPYGAVFAAADNLALGRVRLVGACDGCARCTAACPTGIRVHEEVLRLGMVANSGCMRCLECVSACPHDALAYRFGRPALAAGSRSGLTHYAFSWPEEGLILALFSATFLAVHGLYDAVPLLLALSVGAVAAYCGVLGLRLFRRPVVTLRGIPLRTSGGLTQTGQAFVGASTLLLLFVAHSIVIQYHQQRANAALDALGFPAVERASSPEGRQLARMAAEQLGVCCRYGLIDTVDWNMKLAWVAHLLAKPALVEKHLRRAIALDPAHAAAHFNLAAELVRQGRRVEAAAAFGDAVRLAPSLAQFVPAGILPLRNDAAPDRASLTLPAG